MSVVTVVAMLLSLGLPLALVPSGKGVVGWSWLRDWLGSAPSWAREDPKVPQQQRGKGVDGHYVAAPQARDGESKRKAPGELKKYETSNPGTQGKATGPAKKGFDAATSKRVASLSDAKADTFQNADGSYTRRVYKDPVNFKGADGSWQPIDSTLKAASDRRLTATANAVKISFTPGTARKVDADGTEIPTASGAAAAVDEDLVRLTVEPGVELAYGLTGAALTKAGVSGSVARYRNVFPSVDLELGARASGVKENLVLRSADVPTEYLYPLKLKGLTPRLNAAGEVEFVTAGGRVAVTMPPGFMEDSSNSHAGAGEISYGVRYELVQAAGGPAVKVTVDGAWLRDPKRQFPVTLDPQALVATQYDTYAISTAPTSVRNTEPTIAVGSWNGTEKARGFINFDYFPPTVAGQKLDSARLYMFMTYQGDADGNPCVARAYNVYPITNAWSTGSTTWNAMPGYDTNRLMATDSPSSSLACTNSGQVRNRGVWSAPWLNTQYMMDWAHLGGIYGLAITASESDTAAWKRFTSSDTSLVCPSYFGNTGCAPFIEVNYSANTPPQLDARYPANNTAVSTLTPEFAAKGSDPDNYPNRGLRYNFMLLDDQGAQITQSGWTDGFWRPPAGTLKWGKTYMYYVLVDDRSSIGPANPVPYVFTTAVPQQLVSSSLAQNGGKGFEGSVGNYTTNDVDAQVTTVGPALSITRDYNSLDTRNSAFGRGWSSIVDMQVTEGKDASDVLQTATVRYPNGQDVAFGRNNDGTWSPPSGRFSVFKPITGGYSLTDKDSTAYEFTQSFGTGTGRYGLTKITDANGRILTVQYNGSNQVTQLRSAASNRTLNLTWSTPSGATAAHVATVTTDPADPAVPSSTLTWTYSYTGDKLTTVCPPGTTTACSAYEYQTVNQHNGAVLNTGPYSFWRFNEPSGQSQAKSGVVSNDGTDNGLYNNVTLGAAGPLPNSTSTAATFNGTNASVTLPMKLATESSYQSISMWFKTTATTGVLFSNQKDVVTQGATTPGYYNPALYVDNTGKLRGSIWAGTVGTIVTPGAVNDGQWHHVALAGNGGSQQMYLDGNLVGTLNGVIQLHNLGMDKVYVGAGFLGGGWPGHSYSVATATFFNGQIADVAYHTKPLTQQHVTMLHSSGHTPGEAMTKVTSNAGRVRAIVTYDTVSGRVNQVTDEAGGVWQVGQPTVSGSSQVYASTVLGSRPREYVRLNDTSLPTQAVSQVRSVHSLTYNNVTFGAAGDGSSPFSDTPGAIFNGTSSYLRYNQLQAAMPNYGPNSIEMWFKTPVNHAASGVLYSYQSAAVDSSNPTGTGWVPALYIGSDGYLRGAFWTNSGGPITTTKKVNDGQWHHVVLSATGPDGGAYGADTQTLYLDGVQAGTKSGWMEPQFFEYGYVGAGTTQGWPAASGNVSYFKGNIAEFAYYERQGMSAAEVDAHYKASKSALPVPAGVTGPVLTPVTTVTVTDPGGQTSRKVYDALNNSRLIASTDTLGNTTTYGYDVGGYVNVVYDPLGQKTETAKDVRGNTVRITTCNNQDIGLECQDKLFTYWPDATTVNLTPNARNDQLLSVYGDTGSYSMAKGGLTTFTYDDFGNRLTMTGPPVPDFPTGRTTAMTYTTATTAAVGGGFTPPGLPLTVTSPGGGVQRTDYNAAGDAVKVTDPGGLATEFAYDGLGRLKQQKVLAPGYPAGLVTTYTYDADGQLVQTTEPAVTNAVTGAVHTTRTTDVFDADGFVTSRTASDLTGGDASRVVTSEYNAYGQLVKSVDPMGAVTLYGYDAYGRQTSMVNCDSNPATGSPCPAGDRLQVVTQTFDAEGKLLTSTTTGKDGTSVQETSNAYYANGNLATTTDAMGYVTRYFYYDDSSIKRVERTDGVKTTVLREHTYDWGGHPKVTTTNNGATTTEFVVDNAGRVLSQQIVADGQRRSTNYVYDADDRVVRSRNTVGDQQVAIADSRNTYDAMGRLTSEKHSVDASAGPVGWWTLDGQSPSEDSYWVADASGSLRTIETSSLGSDSPTLGGGYASFRGRSMSTETPVLNTTQSYSVSAWVWVHNSLSGFQTVVGQRGNVNSAFLLQYNQSLGKWAFISPNADTASPSAHYSATSSNALTAGAWVHLVGVFDAPTKRMSVYVNNVRGTDGTNPTPFNSAQGLSIGGLHRDVGPHETLNGAVDNVQVYQRALTDADVAVLYGTAGSARSTTAVANGKELTTAYTVDQRGLTTAMVDPGTNTTNYVYDEDGNRTKIIAPAVTVESFGATAVSSRPTTTVGYNAYGEVVEQQDSLGNVVQTRIDAAGRPWKTIMPSYTPPGGSPIVDASSTIAYDKLGRIVSSTDPRDKTTTYEHDTLGNITKVTGPTGVFSTATYDKVGNVLESVDGTGAKTTSTYDYLGRKLTSTQIVRQPSSVARTTAYDYGTGAYGSSPAAGPWLRKVTSPGGVTAEATYNSVGEQLTSKDGAGNVTTTAYDGLGRAVLLTRPDNTKTATAYDGVGRALNVRRLDAANAVLTTQSVTYDDNSNPITATDARGHTSTLTYNALGQVVGHTQPVTATTSISTSFGFDAAGNPTRFTDGRGNPFWTTYNAWGLPESRIDPSTSAHPNVADRTFTAAYDIGGRLTTETAPGGAQVTLTYDDLGQVVEQAGSGAEAATVARSYGYDGAGRVTSYSVPGGTDTVTYDDRGLPLSVTGPANSVSYTYTADGSLASRADAAGTTNFTYDTAGRLKTVGNGTTNIDLSVTYNTLNQPSQITYGANDKKRVFTYDSLHRVKTDTLSSFDGSVLQGSIAYGYDENSNLTSKTTTGFTGAAANTYTYDWADRLTSWTSGSTTTSYAYDGSGNRTQNGAKTFAYDQRNRLLSQSGGTSYSYTPRGTLSLTSGPGGVYATTSDAFDKAITQQAAGGTVTYAYDALDRVVKPGFKYSGLGNDLADDGSTKYTRGTDGGLLAAGAATGANSKYVWTDLHTDVVGQFTAAGSSLAGSTAYDPLGAVLGATGMVGSLGYQSEFTESATGRVNMLARWYNTDTGQFDSRDSANNSPLPSSVNANRYQYGDGNPMTTVDPTGHWGWSSLKNAVKAVAAPVVKAAAATWNAVQTTYNYVASGQAWQDVKKATNYVVSKAKAATKVVVNSTAKWVKQKVQTVKDKVNDAKKCLSGGVSKCVQQTVKSAVKYVGDTVKNTVNAIREDPWKFIATAAVGIAATIAVGALCATGVGCLILAGAVAGAMASGAGYMVDVGRGDAEFSWGGLADTMIQGGLDGALSAGVGKFTGGATKYATKGASAAASRAFGGGSRANAPGGGSPGRPSASSPASSSGGGGAPRATGGSRNSGGGGSAARAGGGGRSGGGGGGGGGGRRPGGTCPTPHSFAPDTAVLLADGTTKLIKDVVVGDRVLSTDPVTGETGGRVVRTVHRNADTDLTDVVVTARSGDRLTDSLLRTTWSHPFWSETDDAWVKAQDLRRGDRLATDTGEIVEVKQVTNRVGAADMRDLTVTGLHTYYVVVEGAAVLVHNVGGTQPAIPDDFNSVDDPLLWHPGRPGVDTTFQDFVPRREWVRNGASIRPGNYIYVVLGDRSIRAFNTDEWNRSPDAGHTSLARGRPVIMAGQFDVDANGQITYFDNGSGHFRPMWNPHNNALEQIALDAFARNGFQVSDSVDYDPWTDHTHPAPPLGPRAGPPPPSC